MKRWWGGGGGDGSGGKPVEADKASREEVEKARPGFVRQLTGPMQWAGGGRQGQVSKVKKMVGFEPSSLETSMIAGFGYAPCLALSQFI